MRYFTISACIICSIQVATPAQAQQQWRPFESKNSFVHFDAPGLNALPSETWERSDGPQKTKARYYQYLWNKPSGDTAFARVFVNMITAELNYFPTQPHFEKLPTSSDLKNHMASFIDTEQKKAPSPLGAMPFRRLKAGERSCVIFGTAFFSGSQGSALYGSTSAGDTQIYGTYCAPIGHDLSEVDVATILSRLSVTGVGGGHPKTPSPPAFAATALPSQAQSAPTRDTSPSQARVNQRPSSAGTSSILVLWEDEKTPLFGTVQFEHQLATSQISVSAAHNRIQCTGLATATNDQEGQWALRCDNGRIASGIYKITGHGSIGEGKDDLGKRISFTTQR